MIFTVMDLTLEVNTPLYGWKAGSYELQSLQLLSGTPFDDGRPEVMLGNQALDRSYGSDARQGACLSPMEELRHD